MVYQGEIPVSARLMSALEGEFHRLYDVDKGEAFPNGRKPYLSDLDVSLQILESKRDRIIRLPGAFWGGEDFKQRVEVDRQISVLRRMVPELKRAQYGYEAAKQIVGSCHEEGASAQDIAIGIQVFLEDRQRDHRGGHPLSHLEKGFVERLLRMQDKLNNLGVVA